VAGIESDRGFALGDVVHTAQWWTASGPMAPAPETRVTSTTRYVGVSLGGTIHFKMDIEEIPYGTTSPTRKFPITSAKTERSFECTIRVSEQGIAAAKWRTGPGNDDVENRYYWVGDDGALYELASKPPEFVEPERPRIGFRLVAESSSAVE